MTSRLPHHTHSTTGLIAASTLRKNEVSGATRMSLSADSTGPSTSSRRSVRPPAGTSRAQNTTATTATASQYLPDRLSCRGSGGGSPDGRRRRRVRPAAGTGTESPDVTGLTGTDIGRLGVEGCRCAEWYPQVEGSTNAPPHRARAARDL